MFVNVVAPAGGAGGAALFADDFARRGQSPARAASGVLLQLIADFSAFLLILLPGLFYLFIQHDLQPYEILAALILLLITLSLSALLLLGWWKPAWLERLFAWSQRTAGWLSGRFHLSLALADDWAQKNAAEFHQASAAAANHPRKWARTIGIALLAHGVDIASLYLLFRAFNQPISLGALVAGHASGHPVLDCLHCPAGHRRGGG